MHTPRNLGYRNYWVGLNRNLISIQPVENYVNSTSGVQTNSYQADLDNRINIARNNTLSENITISTTMNVTRLERARLMPANNWFTKMAKNFLVSVEIIQETLKHFAPFAPPEELFEIDVRVEADRDKELEEINGEIETQIKVLQKLGEEHKSELNEMYQINSYRKESFRQMYGERLKSLGKVIEARDKTLEEAITKIESMRKEKMIIESDKIKLLEEVKANKRVITRLEGNMETIKNYRVGSDRSFLGKMEQEIDRLKNLVEEKSKIVGESGHGVAIKKTSDNVDKKMLELTGLQNFYMGRIREYTDINNEMLRRGAMTPYEIEMFKSVRKNLATFNAYATQFESMIIALDAQTGFVRGMNKRKKAWEVIKDRAYHYKGVLKAEILSEIKDKQWKQVFKGFDLTPEKRKIILKGLMTTTVDEIEILINSLTILERAGHNIDLKFIMTEFESKDYRDMNKTGFWDQIVDYANQVAQKASDKVIELLVESGFNYLWFIKNH